MAEDGEVRAAGDGVGDAQTAGSEAVCIGDPGAPEVGPVGDGIGAGDRAGDPRWAVHQRAIMVFAGHVGKGCARGLIELVVGNQPAFAAGQFPVHGVLNVCLAARHIPDACLIHLAGQIVAAVFAAQDQLPAVGGHDRGCAGNGLLHAVDIKVARAIVINRRHVIPLPGLEIQAAGGHLVKIKLGSVQAQQIATATRYIFADQAAQSAEAVRLEPAFQRVVRGQIQIVDVEDGYIRIITPAE